MQSLSLGLSCQLTLLIQNIFPTTWYQFSTVRLQVIFRSYSSFPFSLSCSAQYVAAVICGRISFHHRNNFTCIRALTITCIRALHPQYEQQWKQSCPYRNDMKKVFFLLLSFFGLLRCLTREYDEEWRILFKITQLLSYLAKIWHDSVRRALETQNVSTF